MSLQDSLFCLERERYTLLKVQMNIAVVVLLFVLCRADLPAQSDSSLVWPSPPDRGRISHVQTIASNADFKQEKGWWNRVVTFFAGGESDRPWLVQPVGIALAADGRIFIADPGAHCVHVIQPEKKEYDLIAETKFGKLVSPVGLAFDTEGRLYVSDSERHSVIRFDDDLDAEEEFAGTFTRPTGLSIVGSTLYVVDAGAHAVVLSDLDGRKLGEFGRHGFGPGEFNYPIHVTVRDSVYVTDALNYRVQEFDVAGKHLRTIGMQGNVPGRFASPKAAALDSDGNLYVTDALMDNFQIFSPAGRLLLIVGRKGSRNGEFMSPGGIAIDSRDKVYVVDTLNRRIQIFQYHK